MSRLGCYECLVVLSAVGLGPLCWPRTAPASKGDLLPNTHFSGRSQMTHSLRSLCIIVTSFLDEPFMKNDWFFRRIILLQEQRVIRLSKVNVGELISDFSKHRRKVEREVIFANRVFGQLIGPEFVGSVKAVQLSQDQISLLNGMIHESRPGKSFSHYPECVKTRCCWHFDLDNLILLVISQEHRRHKEIRVPYATSHCDFARIHRHHTASVDVCVEIKPKQGWWPSSMRNSDGAMPNLCTYCLNQFLKVSANHKSHFPHFPTWKQRPS